MPELDYKNRPVPDNETADTVIPVWKVTTEPSPGHDYVLIRGWGDMLEYISNQTEKLMENCDDDSEMEEGVSVRVKLHYVTKGEYEDLDTD